MLDHFVIFSQGGLVLWSRSYVGSSAVDVVNLFIREALIGQQASFSTDGSISRWDHEAHSFVWKNDNDLDLVFLAVYRRILQLTYVNDVLEQTGRRFKAQYTEQLTQTPPSYSFTEWDAQFSAILTALEGDSRVLNVKQSAKGAKVSSVNISDSEAPGSQDDSDSIAKNIAAFKAKQRLASSAGRKKNAKVAASDSTEKKKGTKKATKWGHSQLSENDMASYDYSSAPTSDGVEADTSRMIDSGSLGAVKDNGMYEVADYQVNESSDEDDDTAETGGLFSSLISRLSLSPKALTKEDLDPVLASMQNQLVGKNVAHEIAVKVCDSVSRSLLGKKTSVGLTGGGIKKEVKLALESSLTNILTPKTSTDILIEVSKRVDERRSQTGNAQPYCITFVGVNGVGKSTNLSKVAFWLLQNKYRVLIAACDTFRSGAVEQLRVHVKNLSKLDECASRIELFEKGYGKDAAGIAKDAISYAKENGFDVVLIDTAGRMQDNEPLMRALAKLISVNAPDKIVFVGEALVGNEAVDQLSKFDKSLKNFTSLSNPRGIDGIILTKFDTIDDKVGAALSMTYITGQPILFVGTGQTYSDLRSLRVQHIVQALLK